MAPEVITMSHAPTTASDIWSIGCTVIELLTGFPPYFDMVAMSAIYKMVNEDCPPLPDDISDLAQDFLKQCFQKEPDSRPTAEGLRKHPWILEHCPNIQNEEALPGVEEVRKTVKNFTLTKEAGIQLSRDLQEMIDLHDTTAVSSDDESFTSNTSNTSSEFDRSDKKRASSTKKQKKKKDDSDMGTVSLNNNFLIFFYVY